MNSVNIIGNLTRDPEVRYTQGGQPIINLGIAWNGRKKDQSGEWVDQAHFFDVTCFGERFEKLCQYLSKGTKVGVSGKLDFQQWEKDGVKRSKVQIIGNDITFASSRNEEGERPARQEPQPDGYYPANTPTGDDDGIPF